ncbi:DMT family transporter [Alkalicoccus chagannorensis]|uniref:DMT family transporter n=1 Tax=Alkalicoccus chagannorensis TaxID=427072 RepID=UPI000409DE96|nr:DMT family transporter [Alkalicoccus chagannorensis]
MALLYGLITAAAFGVGDFLAGQATKKVSTFVVVLYAQAVGAVLMLPVALFSAHTFSWEAAVWGSLGGAALGLGFLLYFHALSIGKMGVVSAVTGVSSALVPIIAGLGLGEQPGSGALIGILMVVAAIGLISKKEEGAALPSTSSKVLLEALGAGLLLGLFFVFLHVPAAEEGMWAVSAAMTASFAAVAVTLLIRRENLRLTRSSLSYTTFNGILQAFGAVTYVAGVNIGLMSIVAVAGALSPIFTVLCARTLIQERLSKIQWSGFTLALAGVAVLVFTS